MKCRRLPPGPEGGILAGAFLRYAFTTVVRNHRRTLSAILGIVLAMTFTSGSLIAIDSTSQGLLARTLANIDADFVARSTFVGPGINGTTPLPTVGAQGDLGAVDGVVAVEPVKELTELTVVGQDVNASKYGGSVRAVNDSFRAFLGAWTLRGQFTTAPGDVVLTAPTATRLGVGLGQGVSLVHQAYYYPGGGAAPSASVPLQVVGILTPPPSTGAGVYTVIPDAYVGLPAVAGYLQTLNATALDRPPAYYILVDRGRLVDAYNSDATQRNLARVAADLQDAAAPHGLTVDNVIGPALQGFDVLLNAQRALFIAAGLPIMLLGVFLGRVGTELGMADRRRELGILKARGTRDGQVFGLLMIEAVVLGVTAGVLGIAGGVGASRFLLGATSAGLGAPPDYLAVALSPTSVAVTVVASTVLTLVASLRASRRTSKLPVADSLQFYSPGEVTIKYNPSWDVLLLLLAIGTYVFVLYAAALRERLSILVFLVGIIFFALTPFSPLFLIVGLTRLLTQATHRVYGWAAYTAKFFTGELWPLVQRNLVRNPRRASHVCVIIALGIAFGLLITTLYGTQVAYEERQLKATVGSDLKLFVGGNGAQARATLATVPGIGAMASAVSGSSNDAAVVFLDGAGYRATTTPEGYFFTQGYPDALQALDQPGNAIVSLDYADQRFLDLGRHLTVTTFYGNRSYTMRLTVVGVVKAMPGLPGGSIFVDYSTLGFSGDPLVAAGAAVVTFLVKAGAGVDPHDLAARVEAALPGTSPTVYQDELKGLRSNPIREAVLDFFLVEIGFAVLILSAGLGLILYSATLERENEFAGIAARGASLGQTSTVLLGEALAIMVIGASIGVGAGLLTAYIFNQLISSAQPPSALDRPLVVPPEGYILVPVALGAMAVVAFLVSLRIRFMPLARVLRMRGG